ncbi:hypothetical protein DV736_g520, partial [Chaetothyriales sp. CBS 134916]
MTAAPPKPKIAAPAAAASPAAADHRLAVAETDVTGAAGAAGAASASLRTLSQARQLRHGARDAASDDFLSDKATVALIRRVLVNDDGGQRERERERANPQPLEAVLPPLTSSNDVDIQLYAIIAVVIKDFVNSWYGSITADRGFVDEIIHIIAHCSRALEQRLRQTDVIALVLDEVPALLERHIAAYRTATRPQAALAHGPNAQQIYHTLNPHPALDPDQSLEQQERSAAAYRQLLVQAVLACLLPTEDLQNTALRILVTDIVADLILRQAIDDKLSDPCFLYSLVSISLHSASSAHQAKSRRAAVPPAIHADGRSRLDKFGLLSTQHQSPRVSQRSSLQSSLLTHFWTVLHFVYLSLVAVRFLILGLLHARQRAVRQSFGTAPGSAAPKRARVRAVNKSGNDQVVHGVLDYRLFSALSTLLIMPSRMPWLLGFLAFWQHLLSATTTRPSAFSSILDRFTYNTLEQHVFAASDLLSLIPNPVKQVYYATTSEDDMRQAVEEEVLQVFGDSNMNKHLLYAIVELIVVAIVPELIDKTPAELLADRGIIVAPQP